MYTLQCTYVYPTVYKCFFKDVLMYTIWCMRVYVRVYGRISVMVYICCSRTSVSACAHLYTVNIRTLKFCTLKNPGEQMFTGVGPYTNVQQSSWFCSMYIRPSVDSQTGMSTCTVLYSLYFSTRGSLSNASISSDVRLTSPLT